MSCSPDINRLVSDLAEMIAMPSENPPGHETEVARFVARELEPLGFEIAIAEYAPDRPNISATLRNGPGPVFAFNTHMDTVPVGSGWTHEALRMTREGERLYGRGACDCKGSLASMLEAARILATSRAAWSGTLIAVFVADEEVSSQGARFYTRDCPAIDFAIIGEPTSNAVFTAHKGSLRPIVLVEGETAHSGTPELGRNAIYDAGRLMARIEAHHGGVIRHITHPLVGNASLCVTRIGGGKADNVVPDACELLLDRRLVPGEDEEAAKADILALLERARQEEGIVAKVIGYKPTTGGATQTAPDAPLSVAALAAASAADIARPGPFGFQGACDLVHFREAGASGVVIGPGDLANAHKPDEFVTIGELADATRIYVDIVCRLMPPVVKG
ncbi:MAG: M20 family metallopeptidase [Gluconacetobacter liquefaciens]